MASGEGPPRFLFSTYWVEDWTFDTSKVSADDQAWFPPPRWQARDINRDTYFRLLSVPYWLLTGGYAAAWLGGVAGWQRRKAILQKAAAPPPP